MFKKKLLSAVIGMTVLTSQAFAYDPAPFRKAVNGAIKDNLPQPYKAAYEISGGIFKGFLPTPADPDAVYFQKIEDQLQILQQEMQVVLALQEETIEEIYAATTNAEYDSFTTTLSNIQTGAGLTDIKTRTDDLYSSNIFPINGDLYKFASQQCTGSECNNIGTCAVYYLGGNVDPDKKGTNMCDSVSPVEIQSPPSPSITEMVTNYQASLNATSDDWTNLNNYYHTYLNSADSDDYVAMYAKTTSQITELNTQYYQYLMMLYNIQSLQITFYYVNPKFFENESGDKLKSFANNLGGADILSSKTGSAGYEEAMQNLTNNYINKFLGGSKEGTTPVMNIFGGKYLTVSNGKIETYGNRVVGTIDVDSLNNYIAFKLDNTNNKLFTTSSNALFPKTGSDYYGFYGDPDQPAEVSIDSFLNNCQITNAVFPVNDDGKAQFSKVTAMCNIVSEEDGKQSYYTTANIGITVPYQFLDNWTLDIAVPPDP